ncbi:MAG: WXG100 family type VII secretion target [Anaerolineales bacterium]|jgi:WXG100 family type VII secretion target|nr:WXG100 family type VII secretion target [Anaerolineales bacterium]
MKNYMDFYELQNALARMIARQAELVQLIAAFQAIQQDMDSAWSGRAKDAFNAEYGAWLNQLETLNQQLTEMQQDIQHVLNVNDKLNADSDGGLLFGDSTTDAPPPDKK